MKSIRTSSNCNITNCKLIARTLKLVIIKNKTKSRRFKKRDKRLKRFGKTIIVDDGNLCDISEFMCTIT